MLFVICWKKDCINVLHKLLQISRLAKQELKYLMRSTLQSKMTRNALCTVDRVLTSVKELSITLASLHIILKINSMNLSLKRSFYTLWIVFRYTLTLYTEKYIIIHSLFRAQTVSREITARLKPTVDIITDR